MIKKCLLAFAVFSVIIMAVSCKHKKQYTCLCSVRNSPVPQDTSYTLGDISQTSAVQQCAVHNDAVDTCYLMEIH